MKKLHILACGALAMTAALTACSNEDFNINDAESNRIEAYNKAWIKAFGVMDATHDWCMLRSIDAEIAVSGIGGESVRFYNASPKQGGHLTGIATGDCQFKLDVQKNDNEVYAVISDESGQTISEGLYEIIGNKVRIDGSAAATGESRYAHGPNGWFDAMIVCEDLGAISSSDLDFNDIVLGLRHVAGSTKLYITPMAAGGTLSATVKFNGNEKGEIHNLIVPGSSTKNMLNTREFSKAGAVITVDVDEDWRISSGWKNISLHVENNSDAAIEITAPTEGRAPQMICLGGDWFWPTETTDIKDAYPEFKNWTQDKALTTWVDSNTNDKLVVSWDVDKVAPCWFIGTTETGANYYARINGNYDQTLVASGEVYGMDPPTSCEYMFKGRNDLVALDILGSHFNTENVTDMSEMFWGCEKLQELDLSGWNTSNVTTLATAFNSCKALQTLNLSGWDVTKVTSVNDMLSYCDNLETLDMSYWDIRGISGITNVMQSCPKLRTFKMNYGKFASGSQLNDMLNGSKSHIERVELSHADIDGVKSLWGLFRGFNKLKTLDLTGMNTSSVTNMGYMFENCYALTEVPLAGMDLSNVEDMTYMFHNCTGLTSVVCKKINAPKATDMSVLFNACTSLEHIDLSGWTTTSLTNVNDIFHWNENLLTVNLSGWDISHLTNSYYVFERCNKLHTITMEDINMGTGLIFRNFLGEIRYKIPTLNLAGAVSTATTNLSYTFDDCRSLINLDISRWNTSECTTMAYMFNNCHSLTSLDLSHFDTSKVEDMQYMFFDCNSLTSLNLSGWDTSSCKNMFAMIDRCRSLTSLDLRNWDVSNVENFENMFWGSNNLTTLDLRGWTDIKESSRRAAMFTGCQAMTIYCSPTNKLRLQDYVPSGTVFITE